MIQCEAPKIAKLVQITPTSMVYGTDNYSYWGESKPTYNWGASHCTYLNHFCLLFWLFIFHLDLLNWWLRREACRQWLTVAVRIGAVTVVDPGVGVVWFFWRLLVPCPFLLVHKTPCFVLLYSHVGIGDDDGNDDGWLCQYGGMNCSCYPQAILNHKRMTWLSGQWGSRCAACLTVLTMTYYQTAKAAKALKFHLQNASHNQTARRRSP